MAGPGPIRDRVRPSARQRHARGRPSNGRQAVADPVCVSLRLCRICRVSGSGCQTAAVPRPRRAAKASGGGTATPTAGERHRTGHRVDTPTAGEETGNGGTAVDGGRHRGLHGSCLSHHRRLSRIDPTPTESARQGCQPWFETGQRVGANAIGPDLVKGQDRCRHDRHRSGPSASACTMIYAGPARNERWEQVLCLIRIRAVSVTMETA